ncbi:SDR family NAD(P)-dependent oxidoreductase [Paenibacillus guangzhouensis]|uniref:SDR family NAD(P)-dependent oxidoreductase n=1 Tax=Paenibacillus guangzhouensis TaxID=1473112 RepID=UPI00126709EF|nr:SDR family oxidoreductase [Paenibacillus guangzhouensis]
MTAAQQIAIVTGGGSGIGRAIGLELAREQIFVIIADIDPQGREQTVQDISQAGGNARGVHLDVTDPSQVEAVIRDVQQEFGRLDYMFNNAGISMCGELYDTTNEHWERIINVNLWGVIHGTRFAYEIMKQQGFGYIANTASATGLGPSPTAAAYATTKHAVVGLTTSLHYEAETFGVYVSALCPAFVDTPIFGKSETPGMDKAKIQAQMKKQKLMRPDQFARIAVKGLKRNEPIICPMPLRRTMDVVFTLFPSLHRKLMRFVCKTARQASIAAPVPHDSPSADRAL